MAETNLIELEGICKYFSGVPALSDVSFDLRPGEVHALMGENGAGKSTLSKIIAGIYDSDAGSMRVSGNPVRFHSTREAVENGVTIVTQEFSLLPDFSVAENIFLADNSYYRSGFISNRKAMVRDTRSLLKLFEMESYIDPYDRVHKLSVAQMQIVEILKAVSKKAKAIILDEPTASLSGNEIMLLFKLVRRLKGEGVGFIIVSHKINEIYEISDRITVLRDGRLILSGVSTVELGEKELIRAMVGREINDLYGVREKKDPGRFDGAPVVLEVRDLTDGANYVRDISFSVRAGEIAGFSGLVGSGRTELARCIFGADRYSKGQVIVKGKPVKPYNIRRSMEYRMGLMPEDRKQDGLFQELSTTINMCISDLAVNGAAALNHRRDMSRCREKINELNIKVNDVDAPLKSLSGGNQQKVLIAKWLLIEPDVLIVDEPTRGVDIGAKADIYKILKRLASSGVAIVVVSSEIPEILGLCDTVYVMREGRITGRLDASEAHEELIGYYATIG